MHVNPFARAATRDRAVLGVSLMEYLVAIGITGLLVMVVVPFTVYSGKSFASLANYTEMNTQQVLTLDSMSRDIRQAVRLVSYSTNRLVFNDGTNKPPLIFAYSPADRALVRQQGTEQRVLLTDCDALEFKIYRRTPVTGSYDTYLPATENDCKVVTVRWTCSRPILGRKLTTDQAQMAKIIIRKNRI